MSHYQSYRNEDIPKIAEAYSLYGIAEAARMFGLGRGVIPRIIKTLAAQGVIVPKCQFPVARPRLVPKPKRTPEQNATRRDMRRVASESVLRLRATRPRFMTSDVAYDLICRAMPRRSA